MNRFARSSKTERIALKAGRTISMCRATSGTLGTTRSVVPTHNNFLMAVVPFCRALGLILALGLSAGFAGAETNGPANDRLALTHAPGELPAELLDPAYLFEVCRYLYRWQLDEHDLESLPAGAKLRFWLRSLHPPLDEGDRSRLAEILLPGLGMSVRVKKADYTIPELNVTVTSQTYKIVNVARTVLPDRPPADCREVALEQQALLDFLYRTRSQRDYPDEALGQRLREALGRALSAAGETNAPPLINGRHLVHVAPLSPVANELWVFWENGRRLLKFASDVDLAHRAVWNHDRLMVRLYDIDRQVVVSLDETPGSNRFLTRDQVGRVLYNCLVLGRRLELIPAADEAAPAVEPPPPAAAPPPDPAAPLGAGSI